MTDALKDGAARAYTHAFHTGEVTASRRLEEYLAEDVIVEAGSKALHGRDAVLEHVTGQRPGYTATQLGAFGDPRTEGDLLVVDAEFPAFGSGPRRLHLTFSFDDKDQIQKIVETVEGSQPQPKQDQIALSTRGLIDNALINGTPMVLGYVNSQGEPELSLRGSAHIYSPTELAIWLRSSSGGLSKSIAEHPRLTLMYRDNRARTSLILKGTGRIVDDEEVRRRVYERAPEVEQFHDPNQNGAALIIQIDRLAGSTPAGPVNYQS